MANTKPKSAPAQSMYAREMRVAMWTLLGMSVLGQCAIAGYARTVTGFTTGAIVSIMGALAGLFIGFLFGIPRVIRGTKAIEEQNRVESSSSLEDVADWFVKLLLGAGLAQLSTIGTHVTRLAKMVELGFVSDGEATCAEFPCLLPGSTAVALAVVVSYPLIGFLLGFLWTRLRLVYVFGEAEARARTIALVEARSREVFDTAQRKVDAQSAPIARAQVKLDPKELDPEGRLGWARIATELAKPPGASSEDVERAKLAREVFESALQERPSLAHTPLAAETSREVISTDLLGPLYEEGGYLKLLEKYPPEARDQLPAQAMGYLVAALGQKHAKAKPEEKAAVAGEALALMERAIAKDRALASWFEMLLRQDPKSPDDDLVSLAGDERFKKWLADRAGAPK